MFEKSFSAESGAMIANAAKIATMIAAGQNTSRATGASVVVGASTGGCTESEVSDVWVLMGSE